MTLKPWVLGSSLLSLLLTWIIYNEFTEDLAISGTWGCEMSWMTPSYVEIPWKESPMKRYRLFWYREQGWDHEDKPSGLPVIFIPGNAGSYSQVRSIASSASRQFYGETRGSEELPLGTRKLDFFTVDLNEEFSAFHGPTLSQQATYVSSAITHIQSLYPGAKPPVILLGHSMGGVVARLAAISSPEDSISLILTMATPHTISPAPFDYTTESIYRHISSHQLSRPSPLLISVCGGISDTQVVSDTCALASSELHPPDGFTVFTSGLPGAWTGVDHQAMVWCHQIRWAVARALLESASIGERENKLLKLKRWLTDDIADRRPSTLGRQKHKIPVTDRGMSVIARLDHTDLPKMSYCPERGDCRAIEGNISRIPWLKDETKPFPLSGEGVHGDDVASVVDLQLESGTGHLELEATEILGHGALRPMITLNRTEWLSDPQLPVPTRLRLRLPVNVTPLTTYRVYYDTAGCKGHSPVLKVNYEYNGLIESQILAGSKRRAFLSNHIVAPPFLGHSVSKSSSNSISGVELEITQDQACPITHIKVSVAIGPSLAKGVMRYRMVALTWGIGWLALACAKMVISGPTIPLAASEAVLSRPQIIVVIALFGCVLHNSAWTIPGVHSLIVGDSSLLVSIAFTLILGIWTAGIAGIGIATIETASQFASSSHPPSPSPVDAKIPNTGAKPVKPLRYTTGLAQTLTTLLLSLYLPHQLISLGLFVSIWRTVPRENAPQRSAYVRTGAYLLTFGLPFNAIILPVWGRYLWADWNHPFPSEHNLLWVLPILGFLLAAEYGRIGETALIAANVVRWSMISIAMVVFLVGGRYPFAVWTSVQCVLVIIGAVLSL